MPRTNAPFIGLFHYLHFLLPLLRNPAERISVEEWSQQAFRETEHKQEKIHGAVVEVDDAQAMLSLVISMTHVKNPNLSVLNRVPEGRHLINVIVSCSGKVVQISHLLKM